MVIRHVRCAVEYNHGGSRVYAWFGIAVALAIEKRLMVMVVLRAYLHQIGHYGGLDIASPQNGSIGR